MLASMLVPLGLIKLGSKSAAYDCAQASALVIRDS